MAATACSARASLRLPLGRAHDALQAQQHDLGSDPAHERIAGAVHQQQDAAVIIRPLPVAPAGAGSAG